jgi:hypothetical protein
MKEGRTMSYLFNYNRQARMARKLLIDEKIAPVEAVALMSGDGVSQLIRDNYIIVADAGERIILVKKSDMEQFERIAKVLYR